MLCRKRLSITLNTAHLLENREAIIYLFREKYNSSLTIAIVYIPE